MKKWVWCSCVIFLLFGCASVDQKSEKEITEEVFYDTEVLQWANVREYGAVGDATYHCFLGERLGDWDFMVGHYSTLVTENYHVPYLGTEKVSWTYQVISDADTQKGSVLRLTDVNPGRDSYTPTLGDVVVEYTAADLSRSITATDDTAAFERAISASGGCLMLPEGDYMVSQLTAAKIRKIQGPGKIWLKEWRGGETYYLEYGISSMQSYRNYGWIDESYFQDSAWRDMHWITCLPQVRGWKSSEDFIGNFSPRMEFAFTETRDELNVWLTIQPAVPEEEFPDSVTVCVSDLSSNYTVEGSKRWKRSSDESGMGGEMFDLRWNGTKAEISPSAWKSCEDWVEITLKKEDFFRRSEDGILQKWCLHCWNLHSKSIGREKVEYVCNTARVWVKEKSAEGYVMCDIGGDMRTAWEKRNVREGYNLEACNSGTQILTQTPRKFYAYTVPDDLFEQYKPFPR